jgi:hypothetical protein
MGSPERQPRTQPPESAPETQAYEFLSQAENLAQAPVSTKRDQQIATLYKQIENAFITEKGKIKEGIDAMEAWRIMGDDYIGPVEIKVAFGAEIEDIPPIQFSAEELEKAKELNQQLILFVDKAPDGDVLGIEKMNELIKGKTQDDKKFLYRSDDTGGIASDAWFKNEDFIKEPPRPGWRLVSKEVTPNTPSKNYIGQLEEMISHMHSKVFAGKEMPENYKQGIEEFMREKDKLKQLVSTDSEKASEVLANMEIVKLTHETASEAVYKMILNERKMSSSQRLLPNKWSWTATRSSDGNIVSVGNFDANGLLVFRLRPDDSYGALGACLSRS